MIPFNTTTIAIRRPPKGVDPYEDSSTPPKVKTGIRAVIGSPSGRDHVIGGHQSIVTARLTADVCDLHSYDTVEDETTGDQYAVVWVRRRVGLGLDHIAAGLNVVEGASNG